MSGAMIAILILTLLFSAVLIVAAERVRRLYGPAMADDACGPARGVRPRPIDERAVVRPRGSGVPGKGKCGRVAKVGRK